MVKKLAGTKISNARLYNRRVVLEAIRLYGPLSRADIGRRTSLVFPTVANIVDEYLKQGVIETTGRAQGNRGQPALLLSFNRSAAFSLGFHVDRDHVRGVLVDLAGNMLSEEVHWIDMPRPEQTFDLLEAMAERLCEDAKGQRTEVQWDRVIGAGLAVPGPLERTAGTIAAPYFPGWDQVNLAETLSNRLQIPVNLERDAIAAALGEALYGEVGRKHGNFFYMSFFGIGLGGGVMLNGRPYLGENGCAGEIGHLLTSVQQPDGTMVSGTLETFVSLRALFKNLSIEGPVEERIVELKAMSDADDPRLSAWVRRAAHLLMPAISAIENMMDVKALIIGGMLPPMMVTQLIEEISAGLGAVRMQGKKQGLVLSRAMSGNNAASLGAAAMPVFDVLAPDPGLLLNRPNPPATRMTAMQSPNMDASWWYDGKQAVGIRHTLGGLK